MKPMSVAVLGLGLVGFAFPGSGWGAEPCPLELTQAKAELESAQAALGKGMKTAKSQDIQAPRSLAGSRSQDVQAPRAQDIQAPRIDQASKLISEAEAACSKGDVTLSAQKARETLSLLK